MSKILYVASTMGHINNFHLLYISKLREDGNCVKIMSRGDGADYNIPFVKRMFSLKNFLLQRKIKKIIRNEVFDAVILNTTLASFYVRMALPKNNRPRVLNIVHGYLFRDGEKSIKAKLLLLSEKLLRKKTDDIAVMNSEDFIIATKNKLCLGDVVMTYGMGARLSEPLLDVEYIRRYTGTDGKFLLCSVGELSPRKNQRFLISSMPEIKLFVPGALLLLVGDGREKDGLKAFADKIGVADSVYFVGYKSNPCDFIRAADLYVSASEIEGMPFNIIEALGCGVPILASDTKGHSDLIEDGKEGYLYARGCTADFIEKVKKFANGDATVELESQAEKYKKYSFDVVFSKTYRVIKDFCDGEK